MCAPAIDVLFGSPGRFFVFTIKDEFLMFCTVLEPENVAPNFDKNLF